MKQLSVGLSAKEVEARLAALERRVQELTEDVGALRATLADLRRESGKATTTKVGQPD